MTIVLTAWATVASGSTSEWTTSILPDPATRLDYQGGPSAFLMGMGRMTGEETPELFLAQRSIDRNWDDPKPAKPDETTQYTYVEVEGWKSPGAAGAMSFLLPGTGQLYTGHKYGYVMMGIQAAALYTFFHYRDEADAKQSEAFAYAGNPNIQGSNWSFENYEKTASKEESSKLREIYARDPAEFYSLVSSEGAYFSGWEGNTQEEQQENIVNYRQLDEERKDDQRKSRFGLFTAIANSTISMVDAFRAARLNNFMIEENLNLKLDGSTGNHGSFTATLTHKFF